MKNATRFCLLVVALLASWAACAQSAPPPAVVTLSNSAIGTGIVIGGRPPHEVTITVDRVAGWLLCNGALARKSLYPALAARIAENPSS